MARLYKALQDQMVSAIAGGVASQTLYSSIDHGTSTYVRDATCFAYAACNVTSWAVYNSVGGGGAYGCTLIHDRFGIAAAHTLGVGHVASEWANTSWRWVNSSNTTVSRTCTGAVRITGTDIDLLRFNVGVVASGITPAKVLPTDWHDYIPGLLTGVAPGATPTQVVPSLYQDLENKAHIAMWTGENTGTVPGDPGISSATPAECLAYIPNPTGTDVATLLSAYYEQVVSGDSGHAVGLALNGEFVFTAPLGGAGQGSSVTANHAAINTAMDGLLSGASLTDVDLSGYTKNFMSPALRSSGVRRA